MKVIGSAPGPCPKAQPGDPPCNVEVEGQWDQRPDIYLMPNGKVGTAGWRDVYREHGRYCITHRHVFHIPEREVWQ